MGLFGGLFDKKVCAICGGEIGLLGNRKLEDGNLCKQCASQLSPWFSDRRHSTVNEIAAQLAYRNDNRARAAAFHVTRSYGDSFTKVLVDDAMQAFMITGADNFAKENPDVFDFGMVTGCRPDIHEYRHEVMGKDAEGHPVSFQPRRYHYDYQFDMTVTVNHPFIDDMHFSLNSGTIEDADRDELDRYVAMTEDVVETMTGRRPDLSGEVPYHAPFCPDCGHDLAPDGRCLFCHPLIPVAPPRPAAPRPAPAPAPQAPRPQAAPAHGGPQGAPQQRRPQGNQQPQQRGPQGNQQPQQRGPQGNQQQSKPAQHSGSTHETSRQPAQNSGRPGNQSEPPRGGGPRGRG